MLLMRKGKSVAHQSRSQAPIYFLNTHIGNAHKVIADYMMSYFVPQGKY